MPELYILSKFIFAHRVVEGDIHSSQGISVLIQDWFKKKLDKPTKEAILCFVCSPACNLLLLSHAIVNIFGKCYSNDIFSQLVLSLSVCAKIFAQSPTSPFKVHTIIATQQQLHVEHKCQNDCVLFFIVTHTA